MKTTYIALAFLQLLVSSFALLDMQQIRRRCTRQSEHLLSQYPLERRKTANAVKSGWNVSEKQIKIYLNAIRY